MTLVCPVECECDFCHTKFKVNVTPDVENYLTGEPYLNDDVGVAERGGLYICPNGHDNSEECVVGDAIGRVDLLIGQWEK